MEAAAQSDTTWVVLINSCYGQGQPTDSAKPLYDWIMSPDRASAASLRNLRFSVFGLGSSKTHGRYFNVIGRTLDSRLEELGGLRVFVRGEGDDSGSIEEDFEEWSLKFRDFVKAASADAAPAGAGAAAGSETAGMSVCDTKVGSAPASAAASSSSAEMPFRAGAVTVQDPTPSAAAAAPSSSSPSSSSSSSSLSSSSSDPAFFGIDQQAAALLKGALPFKVVAQRRLTENSVRPCYELKLRRTDAPDGESAREYRPDWYKTGDHICIFPENSGPARRLCLLLGKMPDDRFDEEAAGLRLCGVGPNANKAPQFATAERALAALVEFSAPPPARAIRAFADCATNPLEAARLRELSSRSAYEDFFRHQCRSVEDVLREFPSIRIEPEALVRLLPRLRPRYYSIASSAAVTARNGELDLAFRHLIWKTPRGPLKEGLCSSWLARQRPSSFSPSSYSPSSYSPSSSSSSSWEEWTPFGNDGGQIHAVVRESDFHLPEDTTVPLIFIAGGIGMAPFRAFLEERRFQKYEGAKLGPALLFRGFRDPADSLYDDLSARAFRDGLISASITAFDDPNPRGKEAILARSAPLQYARFGQRVGAVMTEPERMKDVWDVLSQGGHVFVCGGATGFGKAVASALKEAAMKVGGHSDESASAYIDGMLESKRYHEDLSD